MKKWLQSNLNNIIVGSFLIPILLVAFVSISHVTTFYSMSNPLSWAIYLSVAVEIAALAALAGISAKFGKFIYIPFGIVTLIQFVGNFFYSYSHIVPNSTDFKNWIDMISGLLEPLGVEPTDIVSHRRILAFLTGGLIPFISLTFAHMLIVYSSKIQTNEDKVVLTDEELIALSKKAGMMEAEQVEEKINPTPEDLVRLEEALKNLEEKSKIEEPIETTETTKYFVDDEEVVTEEGTQGQIKRLIYTKNG
jgi:sensor histidine kinase YesM